MAKKTEETKERRAVRSPEYREAATKVHIRRLRERMQARKTSFESANDHDNEVLSEYEEKLSEIQAEIAKQGSVSTEGEAE
jgi:hypothetical protein